MEEPRTFVHLQINGLNIGEIVDSVISPSCGAVSTFIGTTRNNFQSKTVVKLEYEAYEPMALREMRKVCEKIREKWKILHITIFHRLGEVPVCEASVVIAISSPHRQDSLQAVQFAIDELKSSVPIWKKEIYSDEHGEWKENAECLWSSNKSVVVKIEPPEDIGEDFRGSEDPTKEVLYSQLKVEADPSQVQVRASSEELNRRIDAFITRKREQVNMFNIQEFCSHRNLRDDSESSCARVDAILIPRKDSKSHVKVHRVFNAHGPQTMTSWTQQASPKSPEIVANLNPVLDERLSGPESFLGIDKPVPRNIYQRIKNIEDRILYLESLSPEYRDFFVSPTSGGQERSTRPVRKRTYSTAELDNKLVELEEKYYKRVR